MKKFFAEFKKFITRGNVLDMAVGVIVGGAFTAIVNGLSNFVLKPVINWLLAMILGADTLSELFTFLKRVPALDEAGVPVLDEAGNAVMDLTQSIYIDWGSFINAIINFFLIALVLFCIVKFINKVRTEGQEAKAGKATKEEKKEMKAKGLKPSKKADLEAFRAEKKRIADEEAAKAEAEAAEKARLEREANPTTEDLLKQIIALMNK